MTRAAGTTLSRGHSDAPLTSKSLYGRKPYGTARNEMHRNARDNFVVELGKWGLGREDLVPNVNFFSKVVARDEGELAFVSNRIRAPAPTSFYAPR